MWDRLNQANTAANEGPLSPAGVRALKIAIVVMGIMIIIGVVVVIGRILYLVAQPSSNAPRTVAHATAPLPTTLTLPLPAGANIQHVALDGTRIAVTFKTGEENRIAILDLQTGKKLTEIRVADQTPTPANIPQDE